MSDNKKVASGRENEMCVIRDTKPILHARIKEALIDKGLTDLTENACEGTVGGQYCDDTFFDDLEENLKQSVIDQRCNHGNLKHAARCLVADMQSYLKQFREANQKNKVDTLKIMDHIKETLATQYKESLTKFLNFTKSYIEEDELIRFHNHTSKTYLKQYSELKKPDNAELQNNVYEELKDKLDQIFNTVLNDQKKAVAEISSQIQESIDKHGLENLVKLQQEVTHVSSVDQVVIIYRHLEEATLQNVRDEISNIKGVHLMLAETKIREKLLLNFYHVFSEKSKMLNSLKSECQLLFDKSVTMYKTEILKIVDTKLYHPQVGDLQLEHEKLCDNIVLQFESKLVATTTNTLTEKSRIEYRVRLKQSLQDEYIVFNKFWELTKNDIVSQIEQFLVRSNFEVRQVFKNYVETARTMNEITNAIEVFVIDEEKKFRMQFKRLDEGYLQQCVRDLAKTAKMTFADGLLKLEKTIEIKIELLMKELEVEYSTAVKNKILQDVFIEDNTLLTLHKTNAQIVIEHLKSQTPMWKPAFSERFVDKLKRRLDTLFELLSKEQTFKIETKVAEAEVKAKLMSQTHALNLFARTCADNVGTEVEDFNDAETQRILIDYKINSKLPTDTLYFRETFADLENDLKKVYEMFSESIKRKRSLLTNKNDYDKNENERLLLLREAADQCHMNTEKELEGWVTESFNILNVGSCTNAFYRSLEQTPLTEKFQNSLVDVTTIRNHLSINCGSDLTQLEIFCDTISKFNDMVNDCFSRTVGFSTDEISHQLEEIKRTCLQSKNKSTWIRKYIELGCFKLQPGYIIQNQKIVDNERQLTLFCVDQFQDAYNKKMSCILSAKQLSPEILLKTHNDLQHLCLTKLKQTILFKQETFIFSEARNSLKRLLQKDFLSHKKSNIVNLSNSIISERDKIKHDLITVGHLLLQRVKETKLSHRETNVAVTEIQTSLEVLDRPGVSAEEIFNQVGLFDTYKIKFLKLS